MSTAEPRRTAATRSIDRVLRSVRGVCADFGSSLAAYSCRCPFKGTASAPQGPKPWASCAVVAKRVEDATTPASGFGQWQWETKTSKEQMWKKWLGYARSSV